MKKILLLTLFACLSSAIMSIAATRNGEGDLLVGTYYTEGNKGKVQITKDANQKYDGVLIWTITPGKLDSKNPNPAERNKKMVGKKILRGFTYSGDNVWENGTIYDPENGKTYSCKITRQANGNLKVRGFIGISLLGRTTNWKRIK